MDHVARLDRWFAERLQGLRCSQEAMAYVAGVLGRRDWEASDLSTRSVVLAYQEAAGSGRFELFQRLGDWVLFVDTMYPQHLAGVHEAVETLGRRSYHTCHRIMCGQWFVYEELADGLPGIAWQARRLLSV